ncbi:MAG: hypothetical protein N4A41_08975 [Crocinitomicaceae bacterium]|jgi:hypothetical protein|nr:hypothetical protein [Crocinitomicaceae bacterium]
MKKLAFNFLSLCLFLLSCNPNSGKNKEAETVPSFENKGHELVYHMVQKVGNYQKLARKKGVEYTYSYLTPDGQKDVSHEKYWFAGELSYGKYTQHERTLPAYPGVLEQGFDGEEFWVKSEGELLADSTALKKAAFNRPTNYYWFTMMQKLLDPGLIYAYLGEKVHQNQIYDVVRVSFESKTKEPKDIYQLYINKQTNLVDLFLFTVVDYGKVDTPFLMEVEYEDIDGILIPSRRKYKPSTWNADLSDEPWTEVTWTQIQFTSNLSPADFKK